MINLGHIQHRLAVVSHPGARAAADALHLTQSALSKSIARFEEEPGGKLFNLRGLTLVLTKLGELDDLEIRQPAGKDDTSFQPKKDYWGYLKTDDFAETARM